MKSQYLITLLVMALITSSGLAQNVRGGSTTPQALPAATRLATPGPFHQRLNPLVGEWNVRMTVWPAPGAQPIMSDQLTATREWILGGRYVSERLRGTFGGNASSRDLWFGYNNLEERYEMTTVDTFEPGMMTYLGRAENTVGPIKMYGTNTLAGNGPEILGTKRDLRFEVEVGTDRSVERIFAKLPGQKEFLFVEQIFTKQR